MNRPFAASLARQHDLIAARRVLADPPTDDDAPLIEAAETLLTSPDTDEVAAAAALILWLNPKAPQ